VSLAMLTHRKVEVKRWDVASWQSVPFGPIDVDWAYGLAQSPDRRLLAVGYTGKPPLKLWDWASGELKRVLVSGSGGSYAPVFSTDGRLLAAPVRGEARVWDTSSWREVAIRRFMRIASSRWHSPRRQTVGNRRIYRRATAAGPPGLGLCRSTRADLPGRRRELDYVDEVFSRWEHAGALSWDGVADLWHAPSWDEIEAAEKEGNINVIPGLKWNENVPPVLSI